jgi:tetratricopeptide (TPR) repeat protein
MTMSRPTPVLGAWLVLAAILLGGSGCASRLTAHYAGRLADDVARAAARMDDLDLALQAAPTYLLLLEGLLERRPHDAALLTATAQAYTFYGVLVESEDPTRARRLYQRAKECGRRALARDRRVASLLDAPYDEFTGIGSRLKRADLDRVFWAATSWGAWISQSVDSPSALVDLPKVIYLMQWVLRHDETYYYGSAHVFLGTYHAALPPALGGDPVAARAHFERALEIGQDRLLMTYVQMARYYARQVDDQQLFQSLLHRALELPIGRVPELTLQNAAARALAEKLIEETDELF